MPARALNLCRFRSILDQAGKDSEPGKKAVKGLAEIDRKAEDSLKRAKDQTDRAERDKLLDDVLKKFDGTDWARKAEELKS